jgi:putative NADH-flavin reductase
MNLVVFGATGPTGRQVVRQALAAGHKVTAVTRTPGFTPIGAERVVFAQADVTDARRVSSAVDDAQAVISTYGVPYTRHKVTVYSDGIANIIAGMIEHRVSRLVCVSSTTIAPGEAPGESLFWRKILIPLLRNSVGRTLYDDMQRMETLVAQSTLNWTIVRPGGLFNTAEPTPDYDISTHRLSGRMTSRADLARTLLLEATEPKHPRSAIEVITRSQLPGLRDFRKDAFSKSS